MKNQLKTVDGLPRLLSCELTIVAPVYGNAGTLAELVHRLHAALDSKVINHRILMVDDNSPDDSWQILDRLCRNDKRLAAVKLSANSRQQHALLIGLSLAADSTWMAILDADLQDPPEVISAMYEKSLARNETVFAERFGQYESWDRMLASMLFKSLVGLISGLPRRCGTFFITPKHVIARVLDFSVAHPQLPIMTRIAAGRIATVPFVRLRRPQGQSAYNFQRRLRAAYAGLSCAIACRLKMQAKSVAANPSTIRISAILGQGWAE